MATISFKSNDAKRSENPHDDTLSNGICSQYLSWRRETVNCNLLVRHLVQLYGGSKEMFSSNFISACGILFFASGAMEVALRKSLPLSTPLVSWLLVVWCVIFTTIQIQDLPNQAKDRLCRRKTLPIEFGDFTTRCITAFFIAI